MELLSSSTTLNDARVVLSDNSIAILGTFWLQGTEHQTLPLSVSFSEWSSAQRWHDAAKHQFLLGK